SPGSNSPVPTAVETIVGPVKCAPPSVDLYISWTVTPLRRPTPNTYALPLLSVRIVHPSACWLIPLWVAGPTCETVHVAPPSAERATISGTGSAWPFSWLRNDPQQTYTRPKNGLDDALSAYTCSLSENVVLDSLQRTDGSPPPGASLPAEACRLSVRETPIASKPLNAAPVGKFEVRFA